MKRAFIVVDLGFGDSGKGTTVDALARWCDATLVVRFNGGAQAGHNVVDAVTEKHHCFAQFGAGTFVPKCATLYAFPCLVNPLAMFHEEQHLHAQGVSNAFNRFHVDGRCLMTTPYHRALNRLRELARGRARHGSCGMGIGETVAYAMAAGSSAPVAADVLDPDLLTHKLEAQRVVSKQACAEFGLDASDKLIARELSTFDVPVAELIERYVAWGRRVMVLDPFAVTTLLNHHATIIFEGAQGVLLDEDYGFHPFTTWSTTTARNANIVLDEAECRHTRQVIGVLRAYATRHGAGPFPVEDDLLTRALPDKYNPENLWQSKLRCGWWDFNLLRYSVAVAKANGGLDALALTCLDQVESLSEFRWSDSLDLSQASTSKPLIHAARQALTVALMRTKPLKTHVQKPIAHEVAGLFESELKLPMAIYSEGRTVEGKSFMKRVLA